MNSNIYITAHTTGPRIVLASTWRRARVIRADLRVVLWVIWAVAQLSRINGSSEQMRDAMRQQGFEQISFASECLPLNHNSVDAINAELSGRKFRSRVAVVTGSRPSLVRRAKFRVESNQREVDRSFKDYPGQSAHRRALKTRWYLWGKNGGLEAELFEKIQTGVETYVTARVSGHTMDYSLDAMVEPPRSPVETPTLKGRILNRFPKLPCKWLRDITNTWEAVWDPPMENDDARVPPPTARREPIQLTYHVFKVVDGPVTWEYSVAEKCPDIEVHKHDSQQDDPRKSKLIAEARKEVDGIMERMGIKGQFGSVHTYWDELKRVLKQKHSIDWLSPQDLHPRTNYD